MAEVDGAVYQKPTGLVGVQIFACDLTGATSTISEVTHRFGNRLTAVNIHQRGTNTMTYTISGTTITITGTNNDTVDCIIAGY